jgi:hypothetical protein
LADTNFELERLARVWDIDYSELEFVHRIDAESPGAFGEVWLAHWQDRDVAVKRLHNHIRELDGSSVREFNEEVKVMRSLRHRNIVLFYGVCVALELCSLWPAFVVTWAKPNAIFIACSGHRSTV